MLGSHGSNLATARPLSALYPAHVHSDSGNGLNDLFQEKASPGRDPAGENLLESTKDWSDSGDNRESKRREKKW